MTNPQSPSVPAVRVHLFAGAAAALGADETTAHGTTVAEALADLLAGAGADARTVVERSSLLVDAVACTDRTQVLREGQRLDVLPPFAGG